MQFALLLGGVAAALCNWDLEMVLVQDASSSYSEWFAAMMNSVSDLIDGSERRFAKVRYALSGFTDKPGPFRGVGSGRGYDGELDYCYRRMTALTTSRETMISSYYDLGELAGSGGDGPEDPYDALFFAALDQYLEYEERDSDSAGRDVVRTVLVITDDVPHYQGDLAKGMQMWNQPPSGPLLGDLPHFGDPEFIESPRYYRNDSPAIYGGTEENGEQYRRFLELEAAGKHEEEEYLSLLEHLGPKRFDVDNLKPARALVDLGAGGRDLSVVNCSAYEYPSLEDVRDAVVSRKLIPIFVVAAPPQISIESEDFCNARGYEIGEDSSPEERKAQFLACLTNVYKEDLTVTMGLTDALVVTYESANTQSFVDTVFDALETLAGNKECAVVPGVIPWISGAVAGLAVLGCIAPAFFRKPETLAPTDPNESSISLSDSEEDSCSWTDYV